MSSDDEIQPRSGSMTYADFFGILGWVMVILAIIILITSCLGCTASQLDTINTLLRVTNDITLKSQVIEEKLEKQSVRISQIPKNKKLELEDWLYIFGIITGTTAGAIKTHGVIRNRTFDRRAVRALRHMDVDVDSLPKTSSRRSRRHDPRMGD